MSEKLDLHQKLCEALSVYIKSKGFKRYNFSDVLDLTNDHTLTLQAGRYGVDAVAEKDGEKYYFEVETKSTLRSYNTAKQLISMSTQEGKKFLVVPSTAYEEALNTLRLREISKEIKVMCLPLG